jgi:hypothetical protein
MEQAAKSRCINEDMMSKKEESKWNIEELSDPDIYDAIRYLEPDPLRRKQHKDETAFVIGVTLVILLLGCLGFVWLYLR